MMNNLPGDPHPSTVPCPAASRPVEPASAPAPDGVMRGDAATAVATAALYLVFQGLLQRLHVTNGLVLAGETLISLIITLFFTVRMARALRSPRQQALSLALFALAVLPYTLLPFYPYHSRAEVALAQHVWQVYGSVYHAVAGLHGLLLIGLAASFGALLSQLVREVKLLLPIAVVLALVDLYVVFGGGLVAQAHTGKAPVAQAAMASLTVPLTPRARPGRPAPPPLAVGFADFLFVALFFACFRRFGMPAKETFTLLCIVLSAYMLVVILGKLDLPALVPIAVVVIGRNWRTFRYERSEAFALLYAGLIVAAAIGGLVVYGRLHLPR